MYAGPSSSSSYSLELPSSLSVLDLPTCPFPVQARSQESYLHVSHNLQAHRSHSVSLHIELVVHMSGTHHGKTLACNQGHSVDILNFTRCYSEQVIFRLS
jgi:hypothetical protein